MTRLRIRIPLALFAALLGALLSAPSPPAVAQGPSASARQLGELLRVKRADLDVEDLTLPEVLADLGPRTGIPFVVDPAVWKELDEDDTRVTVALKGLSVENLLDVLMEYTGLAYTFKHQVVWVTTKARMYVGRTRLKLYDVRDLLDKPRNFPGPRIRLKGDGSGPGVVVLPPDDPIEDTRIPGIEELLSLITEVVATDSWADNPEATAQSVGGLLVIRQTPEVHRQIARLLAQIRANK